MLPIPVKSFWVMLAFVVSTSHSTVKMTMSLCIFPVCYAVLGTIRRGTDDPRRLRGCDALYGSLAGVVGRVDTRETQVDAISFLEQHGPSPTIPLVTASSVTQMSRFSSTYRTPFTQ